MQDPAENEHSGQAETADQAGGGQEGGAFPAGRRGLGRGGFGLRLRGRLGLAEGLADGAGELAVGQVLHRDLVEAGQLYQVFGAGDRFARFP